MSVFPTKTLLASDGSEGVNLLATSTTAELARGSVSVIRHAHCPVFVVRQ